MFIITLYVLFNYFEVCYTKKNPFKRSNSKNSTLKPLQYNKGKSTITFLWCIMLFYCYHNSSLHSIIIHKNRWYNTFKTNLLLYIFSVIGLINCINFLEAQNVYIYFDCCNIHFCILFEIILKLCNNMLTIYGLLLCRYVLP